MQQEKARSNVLQLHMSLQNATQHIAQHVPYVAGAAMHLQSALVCHRKPKLRRNSDLLSKPLESLACRADQGLRH